MPNQFIDEELPPELDSVDAPVPIPTLNSVSGPTSDDELLRARLLGQDQQMAELKQAQDTANENRLYARLGQASSNLGSAIARSSPQDQKPWEDLAAGADAPVKAIQGRAKIQNEQDKILRDYLLRQSAMKNTAGIAQLRADTQTGIAGERAGAYDRRTGVLQSVSGQRLGIAKDRLGLAQGSQAAQAANNFNKDKVMQTSNTQLAQIQKGLGRLDDVDNGRVPFSTTIKADIEKDIANVISGGTSSSLGQLHRVEFNPYVSRWQATLDQLRGYQGDINAPEFKKQLRAQLQGLKDDIAMIQGKRAKDLKASLGTAYSQNPLATQAINDNTELYGGNAPQHAPQGPAEMRRKTKDGKIGIFDAATKQFLRWEK